jgi:very-short-patch-repair endonuclease
MNVQIHSSEARVWSRAELRAAGLSPKAITRAVRNGTIRRLRRDHYVAGRSDTDADRAVRLGGRLTCASALATVGAFVLDDRRLHVQVHRSASRLRSAGDRSVAWNRRAEPGVRLHWVDEQEPSHAREAVSLGDAVRAFAQCQPRRQVVATFDSLLHQKIMTLSELRDALAGIDSHSRSVVDLLEPLSESGTESIVRMILAELGVSCEVQVRIRGVGRVDLLVAGRLIIECDSKAFHEGWAAQRKERRRDLAAARLGYITVRLLAEDILYDPKLVMAALAEVVSHL